MSMQLVEEQRWREFFMSALHFACANPRNIRQIDVTNVYTAVGVADWAAEIADESLKAWKKRWAQEQSPYRESRPVYEELGDGDV